MLPDQFRLRRSSDFTRVMRAGRRIGRRSLVMYSLPGQPRFGVVVGKSVGGAVQRNRVKRRLRHMAAGLLDESSPLTVVVRALPAASVEPARLGEDFQSAWRASVEAQR